MNKQPSIEIALALAAGLGLSALSACNAVTGVDNLVVSSGGANAGTPGAQPTSFVNAIAGVSMTEVSLYQTLKRQLMYGGKAVTTGVPIVGGRDTLIRVFLDTDATYKGQPVTVQLFLGNSTTPLEVTQTLSGAPSEDALDSTVNFHVPGATMTGDLKWSIQVGAVSATAGAGPLAYPASGTATMPVEFVGNLLKITIVPVKYGGDGSNRLPDMTAARITAYHDAFKAMYPIPDVQITVHAAFASTVQISADGTGWPNLLNDIAALRQTDKAADDMYYYAPFSPSGSLDDYCGGGCVAGLALLSMGPTDTFSRAAIGLGFNDPDYADVDAAGTALHEIGHNHGRMHSGCMTTDNDPAYPYKGGIDNVVGYDSRSGGQILNPSVADIMGYCRPVWISDYTYEALVTRVQLVNMASIIVPADKQNLMYERVLIDGYGHVEWLAPLQLRTPPLANPRTIMVETNGVTETLSGQFYPFDHLEGGILFWPVGQAAADAVRVRVGSKDLRLTR